MNSLVQYIAFGGMILILTMFAAVFWKIINGRISLSGLMDCDYWDGRKWTTGFSPARAQLLMLTIFAAGNYLLQTVHDPNKLPVLPNNVLEILTGSSTLYLGSKAYWLLSVNPPRNLETSTPRNLETSKNSRNEPEAQ